MKMNLEDVCTALNKVFDHLAVSGVKDIETDQNFYWQVSEAHLYNLNLSNGDVELVVGSLSDDWQFTKELLKKDNQVVPYQLTEIAPLIYAIGLACSQKGLF